MYPIKDIQEYTRIKKVLRDRFESERTGNQDLFREQTKILQPLIDTQVAIQQETAKAIQDASVNNAIVPLTKELQRRNDQVDMLAEQPFYHQEFPAITSMSPEFMKVDLDAGLNETNIEHLQDMSFELPNAVFQNKTTEESLEKIKTENRSIGQKLGARAAHAAAAAAHRGAEPRHQPVDGGGDGPLSRPDSPQPIHRAALDVRDADHLSPLPRAGEMGVAHLGEPGFRACGKSALVPARARDVRPGDARAVVRSDGGAIGHGSCGV